MTVLDVAHCKATLLVDFVPYVFGVSRCFKSANFYTDCSEEPSQTFGNVGCLNRVSEGCSTLKDGNQPEIGVNCE